MRRQKRLAQQLSERRNKWRSKKGRKRLIKGYLEKLLKLFILIVLFGVVFGVIKLKYFLTNSSYFQVEKPTIILENKGIKEEKVYRIFKEFCLKNYSCVEPNIFRLNYTDLKNTLLGNSELEKVSIQRKFPNDILIKVKSRQAEAGILINSRQFGIDKNLVVFKTENVEDLPVITGVGTLKIGHQTEDNRLKDALLLISKIRESEGDLLANVSNIDISNPYDILMMTKIGAIKIHCGSQFVPERLSERIKELETILKYYQQQMQITPEYIDLRFDNIIVKDRK
ncbi:MAG: cell division protein FtsQ/DivIB [bacterium]|nr:cell division protein FtsQ/DivIB [bacterium]